MMSAFIGLLVSQRQQTNFKKVSQEKMKLIKTFAELNLTIIKGCLQKNKEVNL